MSIKNIETERLVRTLAAREGVGVTAAIRLAVATRLANGKSSLPTSAEAGRSTIADLQREWAQLPSMRSDAEVDEWMYDANGLPR